MKRSFETICKEIKEKVKVRKDKSQQEYKKGAAISCTKRNKTMLK